MGKNDKILIDGILEERLEQNSDKIDKGENFEIFAIEQILKNYDLNMEEVKSGFVDGENDGGIDFWFCFLNGHLISDFESIIVPRSSVEIELYIVTCKHDSGFKQAVLNNIYSTISEMFDFSKEKEELIGKYNDNLLRQRDIFTWVYRKTASKLSALNINYIYASRNYVEVVAEPVSGRALQIVELTKSLFSDCISNFDFVGSRELLKLFREKKNFSLEIPYVENLSQTGQRHVILCKLSDYYNFLSDANGKLKNYLFDSNVRDYMGLNNVNDEIMQTLKSNSNIDFWWLNNGVTILSSSATNMGKSLLIEDVQIVNGLQTSRTIYDYFKHNLCTENCESKSIMIKVISQTDSFVKDSIIRATNNQTAVSMISLFATKKLQRDIEAILLKNNFYYERRKNYYINQDIDPSSIIDPLFIAGAYLAIFRQNMTHAIKVRAKHFQDDDFYTYVFSDKTDILLWPTLVRIMKHIEGVYRRVKNRKEFTNLSLKEATYIGGLTLVAIKIGSFAYREEDVISNELMFFDEPLIDEILMYLVSEKTRHRESNNQSNFQKDIVKIISNKYEISNFGAHKKHIRESLKYERLYWSIPLNIIELVEDGLYEDEKIDRETINTFAKKNKLLVHKVNNAIRFIRLMRRYNIDYKKSALNETITLKQT